MVAEPSPRGTFPASWISAINAILTSTFSLNSTSNSGYASTSSYTPQSHNMGPSSSGATSASFSQCVGDDTWSVDPTTHSRPDYCKIYQDALGDEGHGFPLWVPSPNLNLHLTYRRHGVSIGDVGILTPFGAFDFLFNIFKPADDPINAAAPPGFQPLTSSRPNLTDTQRYPYFNEGVHIASQSIAAVQGASDNTL